MFKDDDIQDVYRSEQKRGKRPKDISSIEIETSFAVHPESLRMPALQTNASIMLSSDVQE